MSRIVWLASWPKSGNTWLRIFLANFLSGGSVPVDINELDIHAASTRERFDQALGIESSDLTPDEIQCYRPAAYRQMASQAVDTLFFKVHDAFTIAASGELLIPADASLGAVYIVRNPLDVAISAAHHGGISVDESIRYMADSVVASNPLRLDSHLKQIYLSWSAHVLSWLDQKALPVHLMRYEDMLSQPLEIFQCALRFLGLPDDEERVQRALEFSSFQNLQRQEQARGFRERPAAATGSFFREGRAGQWRESLTTAQVDQIIHDHGAVMRRLGYL